MAGCSKTSIVNHSHCDRFSRLGSCSPVARFSVADVIQDCSDLGLLPELRNALRIAAARDDASAAEAVRDLVYELAGAKNRDLAVDVLIHVTGIAEFDCRSLRDYARKHGMTAEGFRQHVLETRRRLNLPFRSVERPGAN